LAEQIPDPLRGEESYRLLVNAVDDYAIYMLTVDGNVHTWNAGAQRFKGYQAHEIIGRHFSTFYTEEDRATALPQRALQTAIEQGRFESEGWRVRKDGTRFWASVVIDPIRDPSGRVIGFAKITRDITERRKAQQALLESERSFRMLVQGVRDYAIYMLSPQGIITNWNVGAERIKGYRGEEVIGTHFSRFYTEPDRAAGMPQRSLDTAATEGKFESEGWRVRKDGSRFMAHVLVDAIRDETGALVGFAKITRDITERQKAAELLEQTRAKLYQSQKIEAVGKLTGGVAHDFNNVLQIIGGNLELLKRSVAGDPVASDRLMTAVEAVERGARLSSQLLAFARRQPLQPMAVNLGRLLRGMDDLLRRALGESIEVETVVAGGLWNTLIDPNQLENVILNVAINARDAMSGSGKLTLELGNSMLDDMYAAANPDVTAGQYVVLAITDTGSGMTPDVLERAFDPFFTTKPEGVGTGLGLSMAHGFVKQSGGHIKIYSEPGHGTTVRIYLPRSLEAEATMPVRAAGPVTGGSETILVVEDDPAVQATVVELLAELGYRVLRAADAQAALHIIESGTHIDLLFSDVVMPGPVRSPDMAKKAKQMLPALEVLFTSGYTQNAIVHGGRLDPGVELLSKPYRREDLAIKIRRLLDRVPRTPGRHQNTAPVQAADGGATKILVVEDNEDFRTLLCEMLRMLGAAPHSVGSAEDALVSVTSDPVDMVISDVGLPGMSGVDMTKKLRQTHPDLPVILSTGYDVSSSLPPDLKITVLSKPYSMTQLAQALKDAAR
jgi:PAS domain S-box-containing protein